MLSRYSAIRCPSFRLNAVVLRLNSAVAKPAAAAAALEGDPALDSNKEDLTSVGQFYHNMMYRSRQNRLLPVRDLKTLFTMCEEKEHLKYAILGVELYQSKGQDFTEEISSLFVKTCIKHGDPMAAVKIFLKLNRRIAAWQSATSVKRLVEAAYATAAASSLPAPTTEAVNLLGVLQYKGVHVLPETVTLVAGDAAKTNDPVLNKRMVAIIRQCYTEAGKTEDGEALMQQLPVLLSNQAATTKGMIDSKTKAAPEDDEGQDEAKA